METLHYNMHTAKSQLSKLVAQAEAGHEVFITRRGRVAARLVPSQSKDFLNLSAPVQKRPLGIFGGTLWDDKFFDPLPEFEAAFYGDDE